MTVRDVYIFEGLGESGSDAECDDSDTDVLDDVRYARRLRRAPRINERMLRRAARGRRAVAIAETEIEDEAADADTEETALDRAAFGGLGGIGAALAVIGLLILAAAWTGPSWGWRGAGFSTRGPGAYESGLGSRIDYANDAGYPNGPDPRYAMPAIDDGPPPFIEPSRAMFVGGVLVVVGLALLATRRRRFLLS